MVVKILAVTSNTYGMCTTTKMGSTTGAEDPCNDIVNSDYHRVNNYFHYRRRENAYLPLRT